MAIVLGLYPAEWRRRYGAELSALIEDSESASLRDVIDLASSAIAARRRAARAQIHPAIQGGLLNMLQAPSRRPGAFAAVATLITLPTAAFIIVALLKSVAGVSGPFDALEPSVTPLITSPAGGAFIGVAPFMALLLALVPAVRLDLRATRARVVGHIELAVPFSNAVVALVSGALIAIMAAYVVVENL